MIEGLELTTASFGRSIEFHEAVDSTNRIALERARGGAPEGAAVVADSQSAGRGRRGRSWFSPPGANLYVSVVLRPRVPPAVVAQIPLVAAAALHRALAARAPELPLRIKWPNDILTERGAKLAGVLCEAAVESAALRHAVVGMGVNVNVRSFPPDLAGTATSLAIESGREHDRRRLLAAVLNAFEEDYRLWLGARSLAPLLSYLESNSALRGRRVTIRETGGPLAGTAEGIAPGGELLIRDAHGTLHRVTSGEVRLDGDVPPAEP